MPIDMAITVGELITGGSITVKMIEALVKLVNFLRKRGASDKEIDVAIAECLKLNPDMDLIEDAVRRARTSNRATPKKVRMLEEMSKKLNAFEKAVAKKAAPKKAVAKKAAPKKAVAKKAAPKKVVAKKAAPKKVVAKKAAPKKVVAKKAAPKRVVAKRV